MRFISPHGRYSIQVFEGVEQVVMDARGFGATQVLKRPVIADFIPSGLLDHEQEIALESFNFTGLAEGVHPLTTVGVFDTEAYSLEKYGKRERDEMQVQIEERLIELQKMFPTSFIAVEEPVAPRPWGSYDEDEAEDVLKFQERLQIDPSIVRRYETENKGRTEIVKAMTVLEAEAQKVEERIVVEA
jgi:hypothetical protein